MRHYEVRKIERRTHKYTELKKHIWYPD